MTEQAQTAPPVFLFMQPAGRSERRVAIVAVVVTGLAFVALAPVAGQPAARSGLFLPVYESVQVLCDLITAVFLFGQVGVARSRPLLVLAGGYLYCATLATFHMLTFPGLFSEHGLFGAGPQTAAWLYFIWHIGFPGAVFAYAWTRDRSPAPEASAEITTGAVIGMAVAAVFLASVMLVLTTQGHSLFPVIMNGDQDRPTKYVVAWITWLVTLSTLPVLWRRPVLTSLDVWLMVVMISWAFDVAQSAVLNAGRFSFGWYAGRAYGLVASSFLLITLILESGRLYRRLAESYVSERGQRRLVEQRTTELNALNENLEQRVNERTEELASSNRYLHEAREELKTLGRLGVTAREQERTRIARDLHDELGQLLVLAKDQLWELKEPSAPSAADDASNLQRVRELIDMALSTTKGLATSLRPDILDILGLCDAIDWLVSTFCERYPMEFRLHIEPPNVTMEEPWSTVVFRITQESLTNVVRHAGATRVDISLSVDAETIHLQIRDDGCDFEVEAPRKKNSFGVVGMRERVYLVSGRLQIDSTPGRGTVVDVRIPYDQGRH